MVNLGVYRIDIESISKRNLIYSNIILYQSKYAHFEKFSHYLSVPSFYLEFVCRLFPKLLTMLLFYALLLNDIILADVFFKLSLFPEAFSLSPSLFNFHPFLIVIK